ncbi:phosphoribosylaminoimidazolecarboxamide formyltransferase [Alicyclobacillus fodiniaquatilis]|uniref:Phosphoribosylaminoimidazolecarboxamide formyltransferase n=1 Tax=Alicyclobacillus fodiniaquatilis TaxID=1661150 RepID=A0ABW4JNR3_9BACL
MEELRLRYGMNPHQMSAKMMYEGSAPIKILNGEPSLVNMLDALNAFQLARELRKSLSLPAAASFKHVSPAGAAVYSPLSGNLKKSYFVEDLELSPLAVAYARARGTDRMSSFGDCAALSDRVDVSVARLLKREVSDLVVAPGYDNDALEILKTKKNGNYLILEIDPNYEPNPIEQRTVFGIKIEQERNNATITEEILQNVVTTKASIPESAKRDLLLAAITLKYTQSNSVCFALDGQTIGVGAGQQSRIHCTRLAANKADNWYLRQHPIALNMKFHKGIGRPARNNAIDQWTCEELTLPEIREWENNFDEIPHRLSRLETKEWLKGLQGVAYASDAYIPFRDNLDRASQSGVKYVVQAGHSLRDAEVIRAADEYGMVMAFAGLRLFHH